MQIPMSMDRKFDTTIDMELPMSMDPKFNIFRRLTWGSLCQWANFRTH